MTIIRVIFVELNYLYNNEGMVTWHAIAELHTVV